MLSRPRELSGFTSFSGHKRTQYVSMTILDHLVTALRQAARYNRHDLGAPRVVLWPDGERLWEKAIPLLTEALPELLVLGEPDDSLRRGPSTWIRYQLARHTVSEPPIVYLPGIPRHTFRGATGFPEAARHLFALQYQGQFWTQQNGKDWTPAAFLAATDGDLGLDLARDKATLQALAEQLVHILRTPLQQLQGRRLEATDIHALVVADPVRLLLQWLADPAATQKDWTRETWQGFRALCRQQYGLDPDKDGALVASEKLVEGQGLWASVWERYREAPRAYAGVRKLLEPIQPKDLFDEHNERIPTNNRRQEDRLRQSLEALADQSPAQARTALAVRCAEHALRAASVWAELGEAPLARAAVHLAALLAAMEPGLAGIDWATLAESYVRHGWRVDAAAWTALSTVRNAQDLDAVTQALRAVYLPWLESLATRVQALAAAYPYTDPAQARTLQPTAGTIILFVDGLRCDLGLTLRHRLEAPGLTVEFETAWSTLPTVTATAKPAWKPLAERLTGDMISDAFEPVIAATGKPLKTESFRNLLQAVGWNWIEPAALGDPSQTGWTEAGAFDRYGHEQGAKLAWRIDEELQSVLDRVTELLQGGWNTIILITDHGWLLLPGGLPTVDLPKHLTLTRWGRCALAQPGARHGYPQVSWFWGAPHAVVLAPGIAVFQAGIEYAHGGLTLQETLLPVLTVKAAGEETAPVRIASARWVGLRLRVQLEGAAAGLTLDLRTRPADPGSSLLAPEQRLKPVDAEGKTALTVEDGDRIGQVAVLVVVKDNQVICKQAVTIGEN